MSDALTRQNERVVNLTAQCNALAADLRKAEKVLRAIVEGNELPSYPYGMTHAYYMRYRQLAREYFDAKEEGA